jgi:SanA protein
VGFILIGLAVILASTPLAMRAYTDWRYGDDIYTLEDVPARRVAIIFGARVMPDGRLSAMLRDRVAAGAALYHAGKADILLMSGDNHDETYDEPGAMRRYALQLGVPESAIILDPLGLRTYDSCYRAEAVFDIDAAILVTQNFHLDRALMLCQTLGIDAVGVPADYLRPQGYRPRTINWLRLREVAATTMAYIDVVRRPTPHLEPGPDTLAGG